MKIYLMRHGLTDFNMAGKIQGITDNDINELGIEQALSVKPYLKDLNIKHVYTGTLIRQIHTASLVCEGLVVDYQQLENFNELNYGDLEGQTWDVAFPEVNRRVGSNIYSFAQNTVEEISDNFYKADISGKAENSDMAAERFLKGINIIEDKYDNDENVLIVSSAMSIGSFLCKKCSNYDDSIKLYNCCIFSISKFGNAYQYEPYFAGITL